MGIERLLRIVPLRLRSLFRRAAVEQELDEELQYHLERQVAENVRQGMTPDDAWYAAKRALGGIEYQKDQVRDTRGTRWIEELASDLRFAIRSLRRAPGFALTVVLTLALGIGANTAMFTLLRGTLLKPLPNRDGGRLLYLRQSAPGAEEQNVLFSVPEIADYRAVSKTLSAIADYSSVMPFTLVGSDAIPYPAIVGIVSGNYFDVMGLVPVLGRLTNPRDDGASATPVAVLSYQFWMEHYGGDPRVLGRIVRLNDKATTIVGVVQPAPNYPQRTDIYANTVTSPHHLSATMVTMRNHRMSEVFARLAPKATVEQARAELTRIAEMQFNDHPEAYQKAARYQLTVSTLRDALSERASAMFWLLMGAAVFVLLIACANVANLTLMRGVGREREMVVRAALGAGTVRLRRLLVVENLALALTGGALGLAVALALLKALVGFAAQFSPRADEIRVDWVVLAVGLATSVAAAVVLSFIPRLGGDGADPARPLTPTGSGRRMTLGRGRQRVQRSLVVAQVALCMILLTGAGLLMRTLAKLDAVDTGVHAEHVLTMDLPLRNILTQLANQPQNLANYERMRSRVAAIPGVRLASLASTVPLRSFMDFEVKIEGHPLPPNQPTPQASFKTVDVDYFAATGIPLLRGRGFLPTDRRGTEPVVILNKSFATALFGDADPIGRRIAWTGSLLKLTPFSDEWQTVVGVVGDTRDKGLESGPTPTAYRPFAQELIVSGALIVRTAADPSATQAAIVRAIHDVAPGQLITHVATVDEIRDEAVAPRRQNALFIGSFGVLAFVIAMVGIAGVLAFSVSSRTAEIGIRMSLGADAGRVRRMVLGEGGVLLAAGLAIGLSGAWFAVRLLRGFLFGITPHDPATLGAVGVVLAAVGVAACWLPAARAARVDPAVALRAE